MPFPDRLPAMPTPKNSEVILSEVSGINNRDFEQLFNTAVVKMMNLWKSGRGKITKAPGLNRQYSITTGDDAGSAIKVFKKWFKGYQVVAYGNQLKVRDTVAGTTISVVNGSLTADVTDGVKYGTYFFVADGNEGDNVGYLKATLLYDGQTANFNVGKIITGQDSGARAVIIADADGGATGTLTLRILSGSFQNNEVITDNGAVPGSATVNGTLVVTWTEIADAPKCERIEIANGNRLVCGNTDNDVSEAHVSRVDQLSGVPFSAAGDWTVGTNPESPFIVSNPDGGEVSAFGRIGNQIVVLFDDGELGFRIGQIDIGGTGLALDTPIDFQRINFGSSRGVVTTDIGIIKVNEAGVWIMSSGGATDYPYSSSDERISKPLGRDFTKNYSFSDSDIIVDDENELVLVTCMDQSSINNIVLVYHLSKELRGWSTWKKWVSRWLKDGKDIYAASSQETAVFKLDYDIGADDGKNMPTELTVEYNHGKPNGLFRPAGVSIAGELGTGSIITISMDTFDRTWAFSPRVSLNGDNDKSYTFTTGGISSFFPALGSGPMGGTALGGRGIGDRTNTIPSRGQRALGMSDVMRARLRLETSDKHVHTINLLTLFLEDRGVAETSNLT